jgi:polysaccharide biosynthesis protein PslH
MELNILLVTPMPPQPQAPGAIPLVLHAQLSGLRERHQVSLVTVAGQEPGEKQAVIDLQEDGLDVHAVMRQAPNSKRQSWRRRWRMSSAWLIRRWPWRTVWFWEPELQQILDGLFARQEFDLVIVEDNAMGIYTYPTNTPLLFTEHEVRRPRRLDWRFWKHQGLPSWAFSELDWQRWPAYLRCTWRKFDHIQVFSARDAQSIREMAPKLEKPVSVNPFGIVLPEQAEPEREQPKRLLFAGNYTHAPNVDAALWLGREIMPRLSASCPGVRLDLVGIYPPPEVKALESDSIHVLGPVPDIKPFMEGAAVVLAPVRIGGGMRMKVLQSLAMGKAVVTTTRGAQGLDFDGQAPPLRTADDAESFARAAVDLLANPQERIELGQTARAFVAEHFSPQAYTSRIEAIYSKMTALQEKTKRKQYG